jgi:hypothetical protein
MAFLDTYTEHFQSYRHNVSDKARQYACGLMQAGSRKNMDRMAEVVPDAKSRNLQQFLTHSKWDYREVIDHVAYDVDRLLGNDKDACLLIDESGFAKQGKGSVGVSRQWLGRLVFLAFWSTVNLLFLSTDASTCLGNGRTIRSVARKQASRKSNRVFAQSRTLPWRLYGMPEKRAFVLDG